MSLAATIDAMIAAGCSPDQIGAVVRVHEHQREIDAAARREKAAAKKRRQRASVPVCPEDNGGHDGTEGDKKEMSPTPPIRKTTSLRSDIDSACEAEFDLFFSAYPKRTNRKAAKAKFLICRKAVSAERMTEGAKRYAAHCRQSQTEPQFIKAPDVWLNKGCWDDEYLPQQPRAAPGHRPSGRETFAQIAMGNFDDTEFADPPQSSRSAEPSDQRFSGPCVDLSQSAEGNSWEAGGVVNFRPRGAFG